MGDMNVDYKNTSSNEFKKINFFIKSNGLVQAIDSTTRNTDKSKSLLNLNFYKLQVRQMCGNLGAFHKRPSAYLYCTEKRQGM